MTWNNDASERNFMLAQASQRYGVALRTSLTDAGGRKLLRGDAVVAPDTPVVDGLTHLVFTCDAAGRTRLYTNGFDPAPAPRATIAGDFSNWSPSFRLVLANATTVDRPWRGTYHLLAIYSRALSEEEVRKNHVAGL